MLDFRNNPTEELGTSPAQRFFGRRTKTLLPTAGSLLTQTDTDKCQTTQLLRARKDRESFYYNAGSKTLPTLEKGDMVRIQPTKKGQRWTQATVEGPAGVRSYQVTTGDGKAYWRYRRHPRLSAETPRPPLSDSVSDYHFRLNRHHQNLICPRRWLSRSPGMGLLLGPVCCSRHSCTPLRDLE